MIASFVLCLIAGFLTPYTEPFVASAYKSIGRGDWRPLDGVDLRLLTFGLMLLLAATLTTIVGENSSAWLAAAGGLLGYFGGDIYAFARDPHGMKGDAADDWDGDLAEPGQRGSTKDHTDDDAGPETPQQIEEQTAPRASDDPDETLRAVKQAVWPDDPEPEADSAPDTKADAGTGPDPATDTKEGST